MNSGNDFVAVSPRVSSKSSGGKDLFKDLKNDPDYLQIVNEKKDGGFKNIKRELTKEEQSVGIESSGRSMILVSIIIVIIIILIVILVWHFVKNKSDVRKFTVAEELEYYKHLARQNALKMSKMETLLRSGYANSNPAQNSVQPLIQSNDIHHTNDTHYANDVNHNDVRRNDNRVRFEETPSKMSKEELDNLLNKLNNNSKKEIQSPELLNYAPSNNTVSNENSENNRYSGDKNDESDDGFQNADKIMIDKMTENLIMKGDIHDNSIELAMNEDIRYTE
jgi:hypothetical protein